MIAHEIADLIIYSENQRRTALSTILDSLRVMHRENRISEHEYLLAVEWIRDRAKG